MANKKIKFPRWLMPDTKATVECLYRQDGCNSQSEFIEKAILFYCGYLQSEYAGDFLPKILGETLEAILSMFGDRIGKLLLKQAVEQIFGVKVEKVNTIRMEGKEKRQGAAPAGRRASWKKAMVKLTADSKTIEFFEGMV